MPPTARAGRTAPRRPACRRTLTLVAACAAVVIGGIPPLSAQTTQPADGGWFEPGVEVTVDFDGDRPELTPEQEKTFRDLIRQNPELGQNLIEMYPQLAEDPAAPATKPAADAASLLGEAERRDRAAALVGELRTADDARLDTIEAELATLGEAARIELELAALDSDFSTRRRAEVVSGRVRWRQASGESLVKAHPTLIATMASGLPGERAAVVDAVAQSGTGDAVPFLIECVTDAQPYVRQRAIDGLVAIGAEQYSQRAAITALFESILKTGDHDAQLLMIGALSRLGRPRAEVLAPLLSSPVEEVRRTALLALGRSGSADAVPHVRSMLRDERWQVRAAALEALGTLVGEKPADAETGEAVMLAMVDPDPFVRASALRLVGKMNYAKGAERLEQMLDRGEGDERNVLEALAAMKRPAARQRIVERYRQATATPDRVAWLGMLKSYDEDAAVDDLLIEVLKDPKKRDEWPAVLGMWRNDPRHRYFDVVAPKLLDEDPAIVDAAWERLTFQLTAKPLPPHVIEPLRTHRNERRRSIALQAAYIYGDARLDAYVRDALNDRADDVVSMALGMVGTDAIGQSLGATVPTHTRATQAISSGVVDDDSDRGASSTTRPTTRPAVAQQTAAVLRRLAAARQDLVGIKASAILYHTGLADDPATRERLAAALRGVDGAAKAVALAGVATRPGPFLEGLDTNPLLASPETRPAALQLLAASDRPADRARLLELAPSAMLNDPALVAALIRSNDPAARQRAVELWKKNEGYNRDGVLEALRGPAGEGVVAFVRDALAAGEGDWELTRFVERQPDATAAPLLEEMLASGDAQTMYRATGLVRRLKRIDPARATRAVTRLMQSGKADDAYGAQSLYLLVEPDEALADAVVKRGTRGGQARQWPAIVSWLPTPYVDERLVGTMAELPAEAVEAVARRVAREHGVAGLARLLAADVTDPVAREQLSATLADLTAGDAKARPELASLTPAGRAVALSAAGEWPDAATVVDPYLTDADEPTRAAATRGLALYVATARPADLTERQRAALLKGTASEDVGLAYLCVEALAATGEHALKQIDAATVKGITPRLRLVVGGVELPDREKLLAAARTGQKGLTAQRFAIEVGLEPKPGPALPMNLVWPHRDVLVPWAVKTKDVRALEPAVAWGLLKKHDAGFDEAADALVALARKRADGGLLAAIAVAGGVGAPTRQDFELLLRALMPGLRSDSLGATPRQSVEAVARRWARANPQWVRELAGARQASLPAIALEAEVLGSAGAAERLARYVRPPTPGDDPSVGEDSPAGQALAVLRRLGRPKDVKPFVEVLRQVGADDYMQTQLRLSLLQAITLWDPGAMTGVEVENATFPGMAIITADDPATFEKLAARDETELTALMQLARGVLTDPARLAPLLPPWVSGEVELDPTSTDVDAGEADEQEAEFELPDESNGATLSITQSQATATGQQQDARPPVERLRAMLTDDQRSVRLRGLRLAGQGMRTEVADAVAARLAEGDDEAERAEAAQVGAILRQPGAADALAAAMEREPSWAVRVELAASLALLNDARGAAVLDVAERLAVASRLRTRAAMIDRVVPTEPGEGSDMFGVGDEAPARPTSATGWAGSFDLVRGDRVAERERAVHMAPTHGAATAETAPEWPYVEDPAGEAGDGPAVVPVPALVINEHELPFAEVFEAEQALEPAYFVQFAHEVDAQAQLPARWAAWWAEHGQKPADEWWRQAVGQAIGQMGHEKWWQRVVGWRRYQRLTGQTLELPVLTDRAAWVALGERLKDENVAAGEPRKVVIANGVQAGLVDQAAAADELAALVRIAGWGQGDVAVAARLQLGHWPDREALVRAGLAWQTSPASDLRVWVREEMSRRTGRVRLVYEAGELEGR